MSAAARSLAPLLALALCGCAGPTYTISELGQPAFEPLLGATRLERVEGEQTKGFDVFDPNRVEDDGNHRLGMRFWPLGDAEEVAIEVRGYALGGLYLSDLAAAVYPATRSESLEFEASGRLPAASSILYSADSEVEQGNRVLLLRFPRSALPPGCEALVVPVLARFEDGWVHVQYYKTAIPEPLRRESPEEAAARAKAAGAPPGEPTPTAPGEAPLPAPSSEAPAAPPPEPPGGDPGAR